LRALDDDDEVFVADVHRNQQVWLEDPGLHVPERQPWRGRRTAKLQAARKPVTVEAFVKGLAPQAWTRCNLRDSTRGPPRVDIAHRLVFVWDGVEALPRCWHLIVRREVGSPTTLKYSLSNAAPDTPTLRLAQMQATAIGWSASSKMPRKSAALAIIRRSVGRRGTTTSPW